MKNYIVISFLLISGIINGQTDSTLDFSVKVPIDYIHPASGYTTVSYELGADFSPNKPSVFIIADAQQFYVRKGSIKELQHTLFDSTFNVVGIIGRNNNTDLKKTFYDAKGNVNWAEAFTAFCWQQYVNDIDAVRKKLLGNNGRILLYGQSGGGFLVHQYLSVYGSNVDRAFTAAAVNYALDSQSGINHDKFWEESTRKDSNFADKFRQLRKNSVLSRELVAMLFQRQNFFVKPDSLTVEREKLLNALLNNDIASINNYKSKYQINDILSFYASPDGIPIRIRLFEFILPFLKTFNIKPDTLQPNIENLYFSALPLIEAFNKKLIIPTPMEFSSLHCLNTEVFILSGRWDHTADYRSQIALASVYQNNYLFIANDNHTFVTLKNAGLYNSLLTTFLKYGGHSNQFKEIWVRCEPLLWKE